MTSRAQDWALRAQGRTGGGPTEAAGLAQASPCLGPSPHSFKKPLHPPPPPPPIPAEVFSRPHWLTFPQTIPWSSPCCEDQQEAPGKGPGLEAGELGLNSCRFCLTV